MLNIKIFITILPSQRWSFKINYFIVCWLIKTKLPLDIHTLSFWSFTVSFKSIFKKKVRKTKGTKIEFKSHILTFASSWWGDLSWSGPNVINYRVLKPWHSEKEQKHSSLTCYYMYQHKKNIASKITETRTYVLRLKIIDWCLTSSKPLSIIASAACKLKAPATIMNFTFCAKTGKIIF